MARILMYSLGRTFLLGGVIFVMGCSGAEPTNRELGAGAGAALGAGLGAIVGNQTGDSGAGIAIGAATGAIIGGLLGNESDNLDRATAEQEERLRRQREELERQRRELEDLKRQEYHDDSFRRKVAPSPGLESPRSGDTRMMDDADSFHRGEVQPSERSDSNDSNDSFQRY